VAEYFDDGFSGTRFDNRDAFKRMIQDAQEGKLECIMVKDLSRFGRDYLEVGSYMEFVFPAMGVRFISVNDGYDSHRDYGMSGGMDVAYKNLIYQLYSMDLSQKIKSAKKIRNMNGEYTAAFAVFGYKKDPEDRHRLVIDEPAAETVREIFSLAASGLSGSETARILNERKVPTRLQNQWRNGVNYVPRFNVGDYLWCSDQVNDIIRNEQYKGIMIQNRWEVTGFGEAKKIREKSREEWSIVEDGVPRIISDEIFEKANRTITGSKRGKQDTRKKKVNLYVCPYCGRKISKHGAASRKMWCRNRYSGVSAECGQVSMTEEKAQEAVLSIVREACRMQIEERELARTASVDAAKEQKAILLGLKDEHERIEKSTVSSYLSYKEGAYSRDEYTALRKRNQELLADLEQQIDVMESSLRCASGQREEDEEKLYQCSILDEYDGSILQNVVDKVFIYNDRDIQVVFKGDDVFQKERS
jgi:DNA invertase Pin-like site-specific DNA recombinase